MLVRSGKYKIIETGSVIPFDGDTDVEFLITTTLDFTFTLKLVFEENGKERDIEKAVDEKENVISFRCLNFGAGAGTTEPLELATVSGKRVLLHFWTQRMTEKKNIRRIDYTVFLEG